MRNLPIHARVGRLAAVLSVAALVTLVGCGQPPVSFDPSGACVTDGRRAGAYPDLEAALPKGLTERSPDSVDSGRSCSDAALGTFKSHDVTELRFAGATWNQGQSDGTVVAVLTTPPGQPVLEERWVEEFYGTGALNGKHTDNIETSRPTFAGAGEVFRIETLNDLSLQTVLIWNAGGLNHVVIVATQVQPGASRDGHNERIRIAVEAAAAAGTASPPQTQPASEPSSQPASSSAG